MSSPPDSVGGVDFFAYGGLPVPLVSVEEAEGLAASSFGMKVWGCGGGWVVVWLLVVVGVGFVGLVGGAVPFWDGVDGAVLSGPPCAGPTRLGPAM